MRTYKEIEMPIGTFRMYDDTPYVWVQILKPGDRSLVERIDDAFNSGNVKKNS